MKQFHYKKSRIVPEGLEAQQVGEELERIAVAAEGQLTAAVVVEHSKPATALLHEAVDWHIGNKDCADKWRQHKARNIINVIVVEQEAPDGSAGKQMPAYVNIRDESEEAPQRKYVEIQDILDDPVQRARYVQRCLEKLLRVQREFRVLKELSVVWAAVDEAVQRIGQEA